MVEITPKEYVLDRIAEYAPFGSQELGDKHLKQRLCRHLLLGSPFTSLRKQIAEDLCSQFNLKDTSFSDNLRPWSTVQDFVDATAVANLKVPHEMCGLKVKEVALGIQATFTIPKGMSGKMVLDAIEKANPRSQGDGVVWQNSSLLKDPGLGIVVADDTTFTTTICFASNDLSRSEQATYLMNNELDFSHLWILTVAAALYRDANGFPEDRSKIGTPEDKGDLFRGKVVRALTGLIWSDIDGLREYICIKDEPYIFVPAAGSPRTSLCSVAHPT